jgi:hypothetical protein
MRLIILLFVLLPVVGITQVNRSAKELAGETIQDYIGSKLFKNKGYKAVSFGELKQVDDKRSTILWSIAHSFEITEGGGSTFEKSPRKQQSYTFLFYLDDKMKVMKAETYYSK